jgi:hypothetical protein
LNKRVAVVTGLMLAMIMIVSGPASADTYVSIVASESQTIESAISNAVVCVIQWWGYH